MNSSDHEDGPWTADVLTSGAVGTPVDRGVQVVSGGVSNGQFVVDWIRSELVRWCPNGGSRAGYDARRMTKAGVSDWGPAAAALTTQGYAVLPGAMAEGGWRELRAEAEQLQADDAFSGARIGRGEGRREEGATRGGSICWLDATMPAGEAFMGWMDGLRVSLNRALFLGLEGFDAHYAHYPVGAGYGTHVDRHHNTDARVVSAVIYLNADWPVDAGGELVIYDDHGVPRLTLAPEGGTMVLFMSEGTSHEARKATRARWSIAGWFRTRH